MAGILKKISIKESLSARLLLFTICFVLIAEVLIYVPSIANFRENWIEQKIAEANIAILVLEAAPDYIVSRMLTDELLTSTENYSIMRRFDDGMDPQVLRAMEPYNVSARFDIRNVPWTESVRDAFETLIFMNRENYLMEVTGNASGEYGGEIVVVFDEILLCHDMLIYSRNIVLLTIVISLFTAMLVYYSLSNLLVRPVQKITDNMIAFRHAPEDLTKKFIPEDREDEIGLVMQELARMQDDVRKALNQKDHLAKLGGAISNINHDLRNMLSSAQLVSDHLSTIDDPVVQQLAPRFVKAIDRAIRLCENTLQYGGSEVEELNVKTFNLHNLVDDVTTSLGLYENENIKLQNNIATEEKIKADNDQLFRVLMNICRNAVQAIGETGNITINGIVENSQITVDISDDALGIPEKIKENLFQPFKTGSRGGTGLGLAISKEIITAHGGTLDLLKSDASGTTFRIILPLNN
ncbi:MAG: HAMP domain-containing histidine kinase [Kordiimonadaceae bacterium]|jgi:signal transduction histidine kinase|nr:HAMP domain-containing histidine kinase [Kordiimonadaceae bacterium]